MTVWECETFQTCWRRCRNWRQWAEHSVSSWYVELSALNCHNFSWESRAFRFYLISVGFFLCVFFPFFVLVWLEFARFDKNGLTALATLYSEYTMILCYNLCYLWSTSVTVTVLKCTLYGYPEVYSVWLSWGVLCVAVLRSTLCGCPEAYSVWLSWGVLCMAVLRCPLCGLSWGVLCMVVLRCLLYGCTLVSSVWLSWGVLCMAVLGCTLCGCPEVSSVWLSWGVLYMVDRTLKSKS